jgi:hypothetical protein
MFLAKNLSEARKRRDEILSDYSDVAFEQQKLMAA